MVTGFNVDIRHAGRVYHVQTEDRGRKNPIIETLVYEGGRILHQERVSYADQNDESYDESAIVRMVELQHKRIIDAIQAGRFEPQKPFGEEFITKRSFDECVLEYLINEAHNESLGLSVVSESPFEPGKRGWVVVRATHRNSSGPIEGATIRGRLIRASGGPVSLDAATTDEKGESRLEFDVPASEGHAAVIVQAESEFGRDEVHRLIR